MFRRSHALLSALLALVACGGNPPAPAHEPATHAVRADERTPEVVATSSLSSGGSPADPSGPEDHGEAVHAPDAGVVASVSDDGSDGGVATEGDAGATLTSDETHAEAPAEPPATTLRRQCSSERWGGWQGTPACRATARRRIRAADLRCQQDSDCVVIGSSCEPHAVNGHRARRYARWAACVGPGAGGCGYSPRAVCDQGCCVADVFGHGTQRGPPSNP